MSSFPLITSKNYPVEQLQGNLRSGWADALLAGLPFLLGGLAQGVPLVLSALEMTERTSSIPSILSTIFIGLFILSLPVSFLLARAQNWPLWSAGWVPFWVLGVIMFEEWMRGWITGDNEWFPLMDFLMLVVFPPVIAYGLVRVVRAGRLNGILAAMPVMLVSWIVTNEFVSNLPEGIVSLSSWFLAGIVAVLIVRFRGVTFALLSVTGLMLVSGWVHTWNGIYLGGMLPFSEPAPTPGAVFRAFVPLFSFICAIGLGPQLAQSLRDLGLRGGLDWGLPAYRLSLGGIFLMILSALFQIYAQVNGGALHALLPTPDLFARLGTYPAGLWLSLIGLGFYVAGFILVVRAARRGGNLPGWLPTILLFFSLPGVPITLYLASSSVGSIRAFLPPAVGNTLGLGWVAMALFALLFWLRGMSRLNLLPH
ncbi:MAG TPA: hypothetical protein DEQ80_07725 [Anaerolinea thermolimosa]|uniref:Uncharacterized protein n=1 Tax=Anaerolinea thermolimosa TaxID=229919 RepID=A0A3D1JGT4_9CHLR|nr:hypothetical protein [Anaerolinea thermolimosa]